MGVRGFAGRSFWPKNPFVRPENSEKRSSPFPRFFWSSIFVTARFCGGFWAMNSVICVGGVFVWFWVRVFVWIYLPESGSSCFFAVLGTLGPLFRGPVLLLFSSSFFFPLSSLGVGLGSPSSLLCVCRQDTARSRKAGLCITCIALFLFFSPLSALAGPLSLALFFFFSLFFFSSASLSLLHALIRRPSTPRRVIGVNV